MDVVRHIKERGIPVARFATWIVILVVAAVTTLQLTDRLTARPNTGDPLSNVKIAFTVATTGEFATAPGRNRPTMYREPLPIYALAAQIAIDPRLRDAKDAAELNRQPGILALKQHNLVWAFTLLVGMPFALRSLIKNRWIWLLSSLAAISLTRLFFLETPHLLDRNYTEIQAATLLMWSAVVGHAAINSRKLAYFALLGILAGCLALTKAAFFYVIWVYLSAILLLLLVGSPKYSGRQAVLSGVIAIIAAGVVVLPWSARNYEHFGTLSIAERGGVVLWARAVKNQMTDEEWRGAFYVYSRPPISTWVGEQLGFSQEDLDGRLKRLNRRGSFGRADRLAERSGRPQDAVSFYRAARAERVRLRMQFRAQRAPNPTIAADRELQRRAIADILAHPMKHLRTTPVFFWRSMWTVRSTRFGGGTDALVSILGMAAIWTLGVGALVARRAAPFAMVGLAVGIVAFYALASHALPRYVAPTIPVMMVAVCLVAGWGASATVPAISSMLRRARIDWPNRG